jgi:hypothetical protein
MKQSRFTITLLEVLMNSRQAALETYNYYKDPRVVASFRIPLLEDIDTRTMTAIFRLDDDEPEQVNLAYEVCPACHGKAVMTDPRVDAGGLTQEDIEDLEWEDPGFLDRYKAGYYDIPCSTCGGRSTVPVLDRKNNPQEILAAYDKAEREDRAYAAMCASERAHGA